MHTDNKGKPVFNKGDMDALRRVTGMAKHMQAHSENADEESWKQVKEILVKMREDVEPYVRT